MTTEKRLNQPSSIVYRWLTHDENLRNQVQVLVKDSQSNPSTLAQEIKALITDFHNPLTGHSSVYTELIQLVFQEVSWQQIAEIFLQEN